MSSAAKFYKLLAVLLCCEGRSEAIGAVKKVTRSRFALDSLPSGNATALVVAISISRTGTTVTRSVDSAFQMVKTVTGTIR